jgi:hypothetical protein
MRRSFEMIGQRRERLASGGSYAPGSTTGGFTPPARLADVQPGGSHPPLASLTYNRGVHTPRSPGSHPPVAPGCVNLYRVSYNAHRVTSPFAVEIAGPQTTITALPSTYTLPSPIHKSARAAAIPSAKSCRHAQHARHPCADGPSIRRRNIARKPTPRALYRP